MNVDAGVGAGEASLGAGQLEAREDLLLGTVALELRLDRVGLRAVRQLADPGLELGQRALERVEALALDARFGPDREGPARYWRSPIGT